MGSVSPRQVTPVAMVTSLNMEASETQHAYVELAGYNFLSTLEVWLGSTRIETTVRSKELIRCPLPALAELVRLRLDSATAVNL